ncbi:MAG: (2Fe-2S)-binding protein [Patulibacter sp.]
MRRRRRPDRTPGADWTPRPPTGVAVERGAPVTLIVDGQPLAARTGESVTAALLAAGDPHTRTTVAGDPRGAFCGMGVCFECVAVIDGVPNTRTCMTFVRDGMEVRRQEGLGPVPGEAA